MNSTLQQIASALHAEVSGLQVRAPGPNHTPKDRSLTVKLDASAPGGFVVHSFAGDDPIVCNDYVREKCGLEPFKSNGKANGQRWWSRATPIRMRMDRRCLSSIDMTPKASASADQLEKAYGNSRWVMCGESPTVYQQSSRLLLPRSRSASLKVRKRSRR